MFVTTTTDNGASQSLNPQYASWYNLDQLVLSGLLASLSEELLTDVADLSTARDVWVKLEKIYLSRSKARKGQLRQQLATLNKRGLSVAEYYRKMKGFATTLVAIGMPISDDEFISYVLAGLGSEWKSFITSMNTRGGELSLDEFYGYLLAQESRDDDDDIASDVLQSPTADFSTRAPQQRAPLSGLPRGPQGPPRHAGGLRPSAGGAPQFGAHPGGARSGSSGSSGRGPCNPPPPGAIQCQICRRYGHEAYKCWFRMDKNYQPHTAAVAYSPSYQVDTD